MANSGEHALFEDRWPSTNSLRDLVPVVMHGRPNRF